MTGIVFALEWEGHFGGYIVFLVWRRSVVGCSVRYFFLIAVLAVIEPVLYPMLVCFDSRFAQF